MATAQDTAAGTLPGVDKTAALFAILALALFVVFYAATIADIAHICWTQDDYGHGILLPFIAVYMLYEHKEKLRQRLAAYHPGTRRTQWLARMSLLFGLFLYLIGQASDSLYASWVSFFPTSIALVYLLLGPGVGSMAAFPIALNFMAKPLPDALVLKLFWPLQVLSAKVSLFVLEALEVPVYLSGNVIEIPGMRLMVEEACSGMRSVMALLTVSLIVLYFIELRFLFKVLIVFLSVALAMLLNVVRVAMTGVLAHFYDPASATGFFHTFSGFIVFVVGLAVLYGIGKLLTRFDKVAP